MLARKMNGHVQTIPRNKEKGEGIFLKKKTTLGGVPSCVLLMISHTEKEVSYMCILSKSFLL